MQITKEVELIPFRVPNYVLTKQQPKNKGEGVSFDGPKYHLSELDDETLDKLCDQFRKDVFAKAHNN